MATVSITDVKPYENLYIARHRKKLNQAQMGSRLRRTRHEYSDIELGLVPPNFWVEKLDLTQMEICILLRRRNGLNQGQLGEILDISRILINGMENGRLNPARLIKHWRS